MKELIIEARDDNLDVVLEEVEGFLADECRKELMNEILISVDELFINIAHYAYEGERGVAIIQMEILEEPKRVRMVIKDQGIPFNPLAREDPDITLSAKARQTGGLGIFMVKGLMDSCEYEHTDKYNILTLEKKLT